MSIAENFPTWAWIVIGFFGTIGAIFFIYQFKERLIRYALTFICAGASSLMAKGILEMIFVKFLEKGWYGFIGGFLNGIFVAAVTTALIVAFKLYRTQVIVG